MFAARCTGAKLLSLLQLLKLLTRLFLRGVRRREFLAKKFGPSGSSKTQKELSERSF